MGPVTAAMVAAGLDVEVPLLPGHGTTVDDMLATGWSEWSAEVDRALAALEQRCERVIVIGQSMGGTLALWAALHHPTIAGLVCINPATRLRDADTMAMIDELIEDGLAIVPGEGSDIADPDSSDLAYDGTPLAPLRSMMYDGVAAITDRLHELTMPMRLFTSRQDHVVLPSDSDHLADSYGGVVEHIWLERSFHVATLDHDRDIVIAGALDFVCGSTDR